MAKPGRPMRNRTARSFSQLRRFRHAINSDKVFGTHKGQKFGDEPRHALRVPVGISFFEYQVAPDNVSKVSKSLTEAGIAHVGPAGADPNVTDSWHGWALRAGSAGPSDHRAAEKSD